MLVVTFLLNAQVITLTHEYVTSDECIRQAERHRPRAMSADCYLSFTKRASF